jgi:hypothetical protein
LIFSTEIVTHLKPGSGSESGSGITKKPLDSMSIDQKSCFNIREELSSEPGQSPFIKIIVRFGFGTQIGSDPEHRAFTTTAIYNLLGWYMTETYELGVYGACDGKVLATGCSGLAIISRFPFTQVTPLHLNGMYHERSQNVFL